MVLCAVQLWEHQNFFLVIYPSLPKISRTQTSSQRKCTPPSQVIAGTRTDTVRTAHRVPTPVEGVTGFTPTRAPKALIV